MSGGSSMVDIYLAHRAALVNYATPIVGDRMRAEDIVQEAFIKFVPADGTSPPAIEQPVAYLYRIVRNLALDLTRRRAMETRRQAEPEPLWWMLPATPRTPEEETLHQDDLVRVRAALDHLSPRDRQIVAMHRFGGYTMLEIAGRFGLSEASVHRILRRAMVDIARRLAAPTDDASDAGA
tara:strand:- start:1372 stop:1911 length:540 start_codon:yes stop_codon:yes gene_type:complete